MILVSYDLHRPGQNYQELHEAIKNASSAWWHYLDSTWLLKTNLTTQQVDEQVRSHIDSNDRLLIIEVEPRTVKGWLTQEAWDWIR